PYRRVAVLAEHHEHGVALIGVADDAAVIAVGRVRAVGAVTADRAVVGTPGEPVRAGRAVEAARVLDAQLVLVDLIGPVPGGRHAAHLRAVRGERGARLPPVDVVPVPAGVVLQIRLRLDRTHFRVGRARPRHHVRDEVWFGVVPGAVHRQRFTGGHEVVA